MFKTILSLALFTSAAFAQNANIGYPPEGTNVTAGSNITVQIQLPPTLTNTDPISIAIGLETCSTYGGVCLPVAEILGDLLYVGPFNPVYGPGEYFPYQNFSVQVPSTFASGLAQIGVAYFSLIGAGLFPYLQLLNETINIV